MKGYSTDRQTLQISDKRLPPAEHLHGGPMNTWHNIHASPFSYRPLSSEHHHRKCGDIRLHSFAAAQLAIITQQSSGIEHCEREKMRAPSVAPEMKYNTGPVTQISSQKPFRQLAGGYFRDGRCSERLECKP